MSFVPIWTCKLFWIKSITTLRQSSFWLTCSPLIRMLFRRRYWAASLAATAWRLISFWTPFIVLDILSISLSKEIIFSDDPGKPDVSIAVSLWSTDCNCCCISFTNFINSEQITSVAALTADGKNFREFSWLVGTECWLTRWGRADVMGGVSQVATVTATGEVEMASKLHRKPCVLSEQLLALSSSDHSALTWATLAVPMWRLLIPAQELFSSTVDIKISRDISLPLHDSPVYNVSRSSTPSVKYVMWENVAAYICRGPLSRHEINS